MSTKVIIALLAVIVVIILLLTSQRFAQGLRNTARGIIPAGRPIATATPKPSPMIARSVTPTPSIVTGFSNQTTTKGGVTVNQTPDTGAGELSLALLSSFGLVGYAINRFTQKRG